MPRDKRRLQMKFQVEKKMKLANVKIITSYVANFDVDVIVASNKR